MTDNNGTTSDAATGIPTLNTALGTLQQELATLKSAVEHIAMSREAAGTAAQAAERLTESTSVVSQAASRLIGRFEESDIPATLKQIADRTELLREVGLENRFSRIDLEIAQLAAAVREVAVQLGKVESVTTELGSFKLAARLDHVDAEIETLARLHDSLDSQIRELKSTVKSTSDDLSSRFKEFRWMLLLTVITVILLSVLRVLGVLP